MKIALVASLLALFAAGCTAAQRDAFAGICIPGAEVAGCVDINGDHGPGGDTDGDGIGDAE